MSAQDWGGGSHRLVGRHTTIAAYDILGIQIKPRLRRCFQRQTPHRLQSIDECLSHFISATVSSWSVPAPANCWGQPSISFLPVSLPPTSCAASRNAVCHCECRLMNELQKHLVIRTPPTTSRATLERAGVIHSASFAFCTFQKNWRIASNQQGSARPIRDTPEKYRVTGCPLTPTTVATISPKS